MNNATIEKRRSIGSIVARINIGPVNISEELERDLNRVSLPTLRLIESALARDSVA